jgi:hypothetical protein
MSLTYALSAAINGPTGPRATLSHGLYRTKPHRRQSGPRDFHSSQAAGGPARDAVAETRRHRIRGQPVNRAIR